MKSFSIIVKKKIDKFNKSIFVDSDKSISHRALLISSQAFGISKIKGLLQAQDVLNTISALKKLGIKILKKKNFYYIFGNGIGSFNTNGKVIINAGNSGTLARLIMGLLSTYPNKIKIVGDNSLNKRPMERIINPLEKFGCQFEPKNKKKLPISIIGSEMPLAINHEEKIGSAQVKSAIILAALNSPGVTNIKEFKKSRDHTELFFKNAIKVPIKVNKNKKFDLIQVEGGKNFKSFSYHIPGDISSAAFFIVLTKLVFCFSSQFLV